MKILTILTLILLISFTSKVYSQGEYMFDQLSQASPSVTLSSLSYDKETWDEFKNKKTLVVLDGSPSFNKKMITSLKENWTFNEVVFINKSQYERLRTSDSCFFLIFGSISVRSQKSNHFHAFTIVRGNRSLDIEKHKDYTTGSLSLPLNGSSKKHILSITQVRYEDTQYQDSPRDHKKHPLAESEKNYLDSIVNKASYPLIIRSINRYCLLVQNRTIKSLRTYKDYLKVNRKTIKQKKLYILESYLNKKIPNIEVIKQFYSGDVEIISSEKLSKLVKEKVDANVMLFYYDVCGFLGSFKIYNVGKVYNIKSGNTLDIYNRKPFPKKNDYKGIHMVFLKRWNK